MARTDVPTLKALIEAGQFAQAVSALEGVLAAQPGDAVAQTLMGMAQDGLRGSQAAHAAFQAAYDLAPSLPHLQNLVQCLVRQGQGAQVVPLVQSAPETVRATQGFNAFCMAMQDQFGARGDAISLGLTLLEQEPDNADLRAELARLYVISDLHEKALPHLEVLTADADAPAALFANLGMVYARLDRAAEALSACEKATRQAPDVAQHHVTLARCLRQQGQFERAEHALIHAVSLDPQAAETYAALGSFYMARGRFLEAADCFREMTRLTPQAASAHHKLGQALGRLRRYDDAIGVLKTAVRLEPEHAASLNSMGVLFKKTGNLTEAVANYRKAIAVDPDMPDAHNNLANALRDNNELEAAYQVIQDTVTRWPMYGEIHNTLGVMHQQDGAKDKAIGSYRQALALNPELSKAVHNLTSLTQLKADDPLVGQIKERAADPNVIAAEQMNYSFALGNVLRDLGEFPESYAAFEHGNRLRKAELGYDIARDRMLFNAIKTFFRGPARAAPDAQPLQADKRPVFILGMPRSGTSLCEQIISAHPQVHGCGELEFFNQSLKQMPWQDPNFQTIDYEPLRRSYLDAVTGLGFDAHVFTDKMPMNFRWVGWILKAFPEAKIIHMVRDPMAVCWSNYQRFFPAEGMGFTFDQEDIGAYFALYSDLMAFWHETFPGRIFDFVYEDLTLDQEGRSRALCAHLDLPWEDRMLAFHTNTRRVKTASSAQVRERIYTGSSEAWRDFESFLSPMQAQVSVPVTQD